VYQSHYLLPLVNGTNGFSGPGCDSSVVVACGLGRHLEELYALPVQQADSPCDQVVYVRAFAVGIVGIHCRCVCVWCLLRADVVSGPQRLNVCRRYRNNDCTRVRAALRDVVS
jgi:hypothetical protein